MRITSEVVTSGGRVLCVTALGHTVAEAQQRAYALMSDIRWEGCFYRRSDIGWRAIEREKKK
jgi:phosphoribosylamine--glycine ligase